MGLDAVPTFRTSVLFLGIIFKYRVVLSMSEREIVLSLVLLVTVAVSIPAVMVLGEDIIRDEPTPTGGVPFEDSLQTIINGLDWFFSAIETWFGVAY